MLKFGLLILWTLPALCYAIVAVLILTEIMGHDVIFAFHPLLMTAAFILCFSYGIIAYRMEVLEAQKDELGVQKPMEDIRESHRAWQIAGAMAAIGGLVAIITTKISRGHLSMQLSLHATVGFLSLSAVAVQAVVGYLKIKSIKETGEKIHTWHGHFGFVTYGLGIVAVILGAAEVWEGQIEFWAVSILAIIVASLIFILRFTTKYPGGDAQYAGII